MALPAGETASYDGYYHASPECWEVYTGVLAEEYNAPALFGRIHQLTVDTYAVQHAGGDHPDKSVGVHLAGLYLVLERGLMAPQVPPLLQRLAGAVSVWPHFPPPAERAPLTVLGVARSDSAEEHVARVREWGLQVWRLWSAHHGEVADLVSGHL